MKDKQILSILKLALLMSKKVITNDTYFMNGIPKTFFNSGF